MFKVMLEYLVKKTPCLTLNGKLLVRKQDPEIPELFVEIETGNMYEFSVDKDPALMTEKEAQRKIVTELQDLEMILYKLKPLYSYNPKNPERLS